VPLEPTNEYGPGDPTIHLLHLQSTAGAELCWSCEPGRSRLVLSEILVEFKDVDARREKRYQVQAVVKFTWQDAGQRPGMNVGQARDISSGGIFVLASQPLPVGTWVHLDVTLPGIRNREGAHLTTVGCVIRSDGNGFAVAAQSKFGLRLPRDNYQHDEQVLPGVEPGAKGQAAVPAEKSAGTARVARFEGK